MSVLKPDLRSVLLVTLMWLPSCASIINDGSGTRADGVMNSRIVGASRVGVGPTQYSPRLDHDSRVGIRVGEGLGIEYGSRIDDELELGALVEYEPHDGVSVYRGALAANLRWYLAEIGPAEPWVNVAAGYALDDNGGIQYFYSPGYYTGSSGVYWRAGIGVSLPVSEEWSLETSVAVADTGAAGKASISGWIGAAVHF